MLKLIFLLLVAGLVTAAHAEVYQWKDSEGKIHYGEQNKGADKKDVKTVEIRDKYYVPSVEPEVAIKYSASKPHRLVSFNNLKLSLPNSDIESIRIGRIICGEPIDLYWKKGFVDLLSPAIVQGITTRFSELGYVVNSNIKGTPSPTNLSLEGEIIDVKLSMCPSDREREISQNATFLRVKWNLIDPISKKTVFSGESAGSHNALKAKPVKGGTDASLAAALAVATNNLLANRDFVNALAPINMTTLATKFDEQLNVNIKYGSGNGSFKSQTDNLIANTVIVKTKDGFGSGIIINGDGYVLTNAHVVGQEKSFNVIINGEESAAELVRNEVVRDVALIKLSHGFTPTTGVTVSRHAPKIGDEIYIIGAPLALENSQTTTKGIISAFRDLQGLKYFQTDAAINHGSSGGPVFNEKGELIALTVAGLLTRDGAGLSINYLIPIDEVFRYLNLDHAANQQNADVTNHTQQNASVSDKAISMFHLPPALIPIFDWLNSPLWPTTAGVTADASITQPQSVLPAESENKGEKIAIKARGAFIKALVTLHNLKMPLANYYQEHERWPENFNEMGLDPGTIIEAGVTDAIELHKNGVLHLVLSSASFGGKHYLELIPNTSSPIEIRWTCKTSLMTNIAGEQCKGF